MNRLAMVFLWSFLVPAVVEAQIEPSAQSGKAFTHLTFGATVSPLGIGTTIGTNVAIRTDMRAFANYWGINHPFTDSLFNLDLKMRFANAGTLVDFYPLHRLPLRFSPGFLYFNQNRVRLDFRAQPHATIDINGISWASSNTDPIRGTGNLSLTGTGPVFLAGLGHIVPHTRKRLTFPFEAGFALIHTPVVTFNVQGQICHADQSACQPAATYPDFAVNLARQLHQWNANAAPYRLYPILEGGIAYSFNIRGGGYIR